MGIITLPQQESQRYIEVGGGPENLPPKYHTVIDLPKQNKAGGRFASGFGASKTLEPSSKSASNVRSVKSVKNNTLNPSAAVGTSGVEAQQVKKSPGGWKAIFSGGKSRSKSRAKIDLNE